MGETPAASSIEEDIVRDVVVLVLDMATNENGKNVKELLSSTPGKGFESSRL